MRGEEDKKGGKTMLSRSANVSGAGQKKRFTHKNLLYQHIFVGIIVREMEETWRDSSHRFGSGIFPGRLHAASPDPAQNGESNAVAIGVRFGYSRFAITVVGVRLR